MSIIDAAVADKKKSTAKQPPRPIPADTQQVCIDLPGEAIRCNLHKSKLQIVLRKHRDVIFELQLFKGMSYTVEAEGGDFYSVRDKKLFEARLKHKITFKDGERLHLWVGREFKGTLVLKANGKVLGKYQPNQLDLTRYDADPGTKPDPLLIVMKNEESFAGTPIAPTGKVSRDPWGMALWNLNPASSAIGLDAVTMYSRNQPTLSPVEQHPTVAVLDVDSKSIPAEIQKLLDYAGSGGGKSGLADIDPFGVATRNWIAGQIAAIGAYGVDNWKWLKASLNRQANGEFKLIKAKIHRVRGKARIYFSGYNKTNPFFGVGGYGVQHPKIVQIFAGMGGSAEALKSSARAVGATLKGNALVSFVFGSALSIAEWKADLQKDGYDLAATLFTGLIKTLLSAAIAALVVAALLTLILATVAATVSVLLVGALTLVVSVAAAYAVDAADKVAGKKLKGEQNEDGLAAGIAPILREAGNWIAETWSYLSSKFPNDYRPIPNTK